MTKQKVPKAYVSETRTRKDIKQCFGRWGVADYSIGGEAGSKARPLAFVRFSVNGQEQTVQCERAWDYGANLRAVYRLLEALRMAAHYGIMEELASVAVAMLPAGKLRRKPHEVLGITETTPLIVAEAAYRALAKERHPDTGGSDDAMRELNEAIGGFRQTSAE